MNFKNDCLMKNLFKVIFVAAATTALFACNKEIENPTPENPVNVRTVQFNAGPVTKTVFGTLSGTTLPTLWTVNETVGISLNFASIKQSTTPEVASGGATATFSADIEESGSAPYTFYAVSPYSSILGVSNTYYSATIIIPAAQTPLDNSVDEAAQVLIAKYEAGSTFPTTSVNMAFEHLTAYGKISFSNLALAVGETIETVSLTAAENWAGRYYYYFEDNERGNNAGDLGENSVGKTITLTTSASSNIWFACAPVDLGGKTIDVVITTNKGTTYSKTITIPAGKAFESGKVNAFKINMSGITADSAVDYELVTDASDLGDGDEVIIAAYGDINYAISTTQNTNNRAAAAAIKSADGSVISSPDAAVQVFTIEDGNKSNTIAFSTGSGYLAAANSSSNYMHTDASLTDNSSWSVSITSDGEATVVAQGTYTRNVMRYNPNNGNPIFSCYGSTSTTGAKVSIYKKAVPDTREESGIAWSDDEGMGDVKNQELALPSLTNPNSLTVTYSSSDPTVATVAENAHTVTLLKAGTTEIHAIFGGDATYKKANVYYTLTVDDTRTAVTLSFGTASYTLTLGTPDYTSFTGQTVTASPSVSGITYALTGAAVGTLNKNTGAITLDGSTTGTATITASYDGDATHKPAESVSYTVAVSSGSSVPDPETITFSSLDLENSVQYTDPFDGGNFTVTFAGGDNDGKYYTTGTGIRTYGGGTITVASSHTISEIEFTWSGNSYKPTSDVATPTGYNNSTGKWTGSAKSVVLTRPSGSGHWRLQAVKVTYAD